MTKNESKLLSIQGIAKASAFCLLLSAFSVNAAMAAPAPAGTVDEVMAVQQGKKVTGVVVDGTGEPVIGANVVVKGADAYHLEHVQLPTLYGVISPF